MWEKKKSGKKNSQNVKESLTFFFNSTIVAVSYTHLMLDLMCAVGREPFYHKHEFISRPTDKLGPGMIRYIRK